MLPNEKPSLTVHAVWAYSLTSRAASSAQAGCHPRTASSARITISRAAARTAIPDVIRSPLYEAPILVHRAWRANHPLSVDWARLALSLLGLPIRSIMPTIREIVYIIPAGGGWRGHGA